MKIELPEIPRSWLIMILMCGLIMLRGFGIDTFVTAGISALIAYLLGVKLEQGRKYGNQTQNN